LALASNLRAAPDASAPVLGTLRAGARVMVVARLGGWLQVGDESRSLGWVHVSRAEGSAGAEP
jgi:SH3-like domain-containing protein